MFATNIIIVCAHTSSHHPFPLRIRTAGGSVYISAGVLNQPIHTKYFSGQVRDDAYRSGGAAAGGGPLVAGVANAPPGRILADGGWGFNGTLGGAQPAYGGSGGRVHFACGRSTLPFDPLARGSWPVAISAAAGCYNPDFGLDGSNTQCSAAGTVVVACGVAPADLTRMALAAATPDPVLQATLLPPAVTASSLPPILLLDGGPGRETRDYDRTTPLRTLLLGAPLHFVVSSLVIRNGASLALDGDGAYLQVSNMRVSLTVTTGCIHAQPFGDANANDIILAKRALLRIGAARVPDPHPNATAPVMCGVNVTAYSKYLTPESATAFIGPKSATGFSDVATLLEGVRIGRDDADPSAQATLQLPPAIVLQGSVFNAPPAISPCEGIAGWGDPTATSSMGLAPPTAFTDMFNQTALANRTWPSILAVSRPSRPDLVDIPTVATSKVWWGPAMTFPLVNSRCRSGCEITLGHVVLAHDTYWNTGTATSNHHLVLSTGSFTYRGGNDGQSVIWNGPGVTTFASAGDFTVDCLNDGSCEISWEARLNIIARNVFIGTGTSIVSANEGDFNATAPGHPYSAATASQSSGGASHGECGDVAW